MGVHLQQVAVERVKHQAPEEGRGSLSRGCACPAPPIACAQETHISHQGPGAATQLGSCLTWWGTWGRTCTAGSRGGTRCRQGAPAAARRPAPRSRVTYTLQGARRELLQLLQPQLRGMGGAVEPATAGQERSKPKGAVEPTNGTVAQGPGRPFLGAPEQTPCCQVEGRSPDFPKTGLSLLQ